MASKVRFHMVIEQKDGMFDRWISLLFKDLTNTRLTPNVNETGLACVSCTLDWTRKERAWLETWLTELHSKDRGLAQVRWTNNQYISGKAVTSVHSTHAQDVSDSQTVHLCQMLNETAGKTSFAHQFPQDYQASLLSLVAVTLLVDFETRAKRETTKGNESVVISYTIVILA